MKPIKALPAQVPSILRLAAVAGVIAARRRLKLVLSLNVRDFEPKATGRRTRAALQQSIDRCWVLGGASSDPAGEYLTGALALRSNTVLRLQKDATIVGSPDLADIP